jgi:hypothetical protein
MAKQDLYKTAQQSAKLFKLISENEELESWVSKKITKAAADIESVYQYLNYEKHFKEQERAINSNTSLSESAKEELRAKLAEAKDKVAKMKIKAAKEKSKMDENAFDYKNKGEMKVGDTKKTRTGELTKTATGVVHKNTSYHDDGDADDKSGKGIKSHAKAKSASEKKAEAPAQKKSKSGTWGMEGGQKFDNRKVSEAKAKCCCEEKGKAKCPVHGKVEEAKELKGGQKKLDKNHNGKLDSDDFAKLRAKKNIKEAIARAQALLDEGKKKASGKKPAWLEKAEVEAEEKEGKKVSKKEEKKVGIVKESAEFDRLKFLNKQLNG